MTPTLSSAETLEHSVFMALMWAISHPGEVQTLEGIRAANSAMPILESVGQALLDLETDFFTPSVDLRKHFERLGAQFHPAQEASYQFYPQVDQAAMDQLKEAPIGSLAHPETGTTLVLGTKFGQGLCLRLSGSGIQSTREIQVNLPEHFWNLRNERVSFPLGWDIFLVSDIQIIGIPRSTHVEVI